MITSTSNERVKLARALLTEAKTRRKSSLLALEGVRLINDALSAGAVPEFIFYNPEQIQPDVLHGSPNEWGELIQVNAQVIRHISSTEHPQGIVGIFPTPSLRLPEHPRRVLVLDGLRDPGNVGTILRTAAAAGVEVVLFSPGCVDIGNDKVLRGAMGAHFRLALRDWPWSQIAGFCGETTVYLADMTGNVAYDTADWDAPWTLIVGSEAEGASPEAEQLAAHTIYIPMAPGAESLNAAMAAGILLFEAAKRR
ncbi:MAG: RNA methyltransferase [Chloroflexi bacterium]|nr:RNA methyltransferase [Chloroflexota bacterium]